MGLVTEDEAEAFAAAWRCVQAAGDAQGVLFGEPEDHVRVAALAMKLELPQGKEQYEFLLMQGHGVTRCPTCGEDASDLEPYDIGSGPELSCINCQSCWGVHGQLLKPVDASILRRAMRKESDS